MDDRKTRITKLSERFKPHAGRPKRSSKQRERRSYYLDTEITERLDRDYKEFSHQVYPQTVSKSVFIETIIAYGLDNLSVVGEIVTAQSASSSCCRSRLLVSFWGRDKRVAIKDVPEGLKDVFAILTGGGDVSANATEALGACKRTESARHLLFHFHHPDIPLPLIVVKGNAKVGHERQHLTFEVAKTD
jgi:hypothetical protein